MSTTLTAEETLDEFRAAGALDADEAGPAVRRSAARPLRQSPAELRQTALEMELTG